MAKKTKKSVKKTTKKVSKSKNLKKAILKGPRMPIAPLGDRILIKELGEEEMFKTSASGIIIPDSSKDEGGKRGKVVAVGSGKVEDGVRVPVSVEVGQTVLYTWGDKIKVGNDEYVIVRESEIIAILN